jgi:hypothetical protein
MIKDGVGMHWEQSSIWETKKHPIMSCLTQGIEANFSGDIKFTGKNRMFLPTTVITTLQLEF